jgi:predicted MPP superfamily phosphohydrolase
MRVASTNKRPLSRREFIKLTGLALATGLTTSIGGWGYASEIEPGWLDITSVPLELERLNPVFAGFRLAQISDIHLGGWMDRARLQNVVQTVLSLQPEVVAITGDFLIGHGWNSAKAQWIADLQAALRPLAQACLTVAVLGNHDYWTNPRAARQMLVESGIVELSNAVYSLERSGERLHLAGVDDITEQKDRLDLVLAQLPADGAAILLAHEPDFADTSAATGRFDLQLSGHSHGGQVVLPHFGPPVLPYLGQKYYSGLYRLGGMFQYTNRGVGMTRPAARINCRPEITLFTFCPQGVMR